MDYKKFAAKFVEIFTEYAAQYPKSEWVQSVLQHYTALIENSRGLTITDEDAAIHIKANQEFWIVLRDNPELTTQQMMDGDYKIPAEWR